MKRIAALILLASLSTSAFALEPFVVSDIRIEGLSRISAGTVFNYLSINKGDRLTNEEAQQAIRALYNTKFFSDVELERDGSILVVKVVERPSIAKLTIRGNNDIKTDDLKKGLKDIGLTEGETFDRLAIDRVQQELIRQYYNRGKYNVSVIPHVTELDRNRVSIDIEIREGKVAKVKEVNIVGNTAFTDKEIEKDFETGTTNWLSWYSKNDQYSQDKLSGDLKKLQSYYMDRGYADFGLDSSQVTIAPDKRAMYITADVVQGDIYHISDTHLLGQLILPEDTLRKLVFVKNGDLFSRRAIEATSDSIKALLANIGYAFAKVNSVPKLDKDKHTVDVTWYIQPGPRVYVRRVIFQGNTRTEDDVLRREMRQLEGSWYSQAAIDRSKIRLQQLGFFKTVTIDKQVVPGSDDEVDLTVKVEEQSAGSLTFGVGYSQYSGIILSSSVSQNNFLGTGDRFSVSAERSDYLTQINAGYYNPFLTENGVGIGYNATFSRADYSNLGSQYASYSNSTKSFSTTLGIPVTDFDRISGSLGIGSTKINTYEGYTPQPLVDYINALGHQTIHSWTGSLSWVHDTRNSYWAPTHGGQLTATVSTALPGSTVQYWIFNGEANHYWPIGKGFVLYVDGKVAYGDTYGNQKYANTTSDYTPAGGGNAQVGYKAGQTVAFPFWMNFYAGGVTDVRGFQDNTLGPRVCAGVDTNGAPIKAQSNGYCPNSTYSYAQPVGGAFKVLGTTELYLPLPFLKDINTARVSLFVDVGQAYTNLQSFKFGGLDASAGISLHWQAPIGPLIISLGFPFRTQPGDSQYLERIQFTFGSQF
ncbi:outer membrane protein assembly factor BamA [Dyella lipolytica]|uniref:Outer membrane protein assembly factor BamA n=1 Tax=Dyella lipolytica TaxID=1867835 RepID=A0ABW8J029_9GAMM|nr:outer membrane protein assembly factor BamA [Dyella lipolytica]GLQ45260.1 outer membrane protein assembly factor BamA [Dyella lipolytica]